MGQILTFLSAFRLKSDESKIRIDDRESVLKKYGDKRLLVKTMAEKEFERVSLDNELSGGIRARVKTGNNGGTGTTIKKVRSNKEEKERAED